MPCNSSKAMITLIPGTDNGLLFVTYANVSLLPLVTSCVRGCLGLSAFKMMSRHFTHLGGMLPAGHTNMRFLWKVLNLRVHGLQTLSGGMFILIP